MFSRRSLTSWSGLAMAAGMVAALGGCGGGDEAGQGSASGSRFLAETGSAAGPAVAAGTIRMHYHRIQGDSAQWGV